MTKHTLDMTQSSCAQPSRDALCHDRRPSVQDPVYSHFFQQLLLGSDFMAGLPTATTARTLHDPSRIAAPLNRNGALSSSRNARLVAVEYEVAYIRREKPHARRFIPKQTDAGILLNACDARCSCASNRPHADVNTRFAIWLWVPGLAEFTLGPREARTRGLARTRNRALFRREAGRLHDLGPALELQLDAVFEGGADEPAHLEALRGELGLDGGVGVRRGRRRLQPLDHIDRRARFHQQPEPGARGEIAEAHVRQGRYLGQKR